MLDKCISDEKDKAIALVKHIKELAVKYFFEKVDNENEENNKVEEH